MRDHEVTERLVMHWVPVVDAARTHPHGGALDRRGPGEHPRSKPHAA